VSKVKDRFTKLYRRKAGLLETNNLLRREIDMKKLFSIVLTALLVACGQVVDTAKDDTSTQTAPASQVATAQPLTPEVKASDETVAVAISTPQVNTWKDYEKAKREAWLRYEATKRAAFVLYMDAEKAELEKLRDKNRDAFVALIEEERMSNRSADSLLNKKQEHPDVVVYKTAKDKAYAEYTRVDKLAYEKYQREDAEAYKKYSAQKNT
jgi:hypothetical protein